MIRETEVKLKLDNIDAKTFIDSCKMIYPEITMSKSFQRDEYYDTEDFQLRKNDLVVRVRKKTDATMLAVKSPRVYLSEYVQNRIELEFDICDSFVIKQLESQNLKPVTIIEKRRITIKGNYFTIEIDELPYIGPFLEIEAETIETINDISAKLSLDSLQEVKENYGELLEREFAKLGLPTDPVLVATFDRL